ncbi:hypothetical protein PVAND_016558 [Polypedilum vanderplanki]|uniref:Uncharacterized protein n=1 Tax=Polypedilum vanderplanki TaxID=319348 RepID=A0A9J6BGA2_POLVA|nr:hypothetical protein PVAND_016558 [Polypedilum vanderplanki]
MKTFTNILLFTFTTFVMSDNEKIFAAEIEKKIAFSEFKEDLNKTYENKKEEKVAFTNFKETFEVVQKHNEDFNRGNTSFTMQINKNADESEDFFMARLNFDLETDVMDARADDDYPIVPKCNKQFLNYSMDGFVNNIKNQGRCGACYAFAVAGACEGAFYKKYKKLYKIAEQQLVDCTKSNEYGNRGCVGGKISASYGYLSHWKAMNESEYPYKARDNGTCLYNETVAISKITNYIKLTNVNETYLKDLLCVYGPLTVGIDASAKTFQYYSSGVYYDEECGTTINHAVLLIGFGTDPEFGPYWLLKNSYGKNWGERGYIRISRGKGNVCAFLNQITACII